MKQRAVTRGTSVFFLIWFSQLFSLFGSGLTSFALGVWVFQETGSVTAYALVILCLMGPNALLSLFTGPLVDRWDRRWVMLLSDGGAGLCTLVILLLLFSGRLALGPILLATAASSAFSAFQWPAYAAATTLLVPKEHYGRANGMVQVGQAVSYIASPVLAGFLLAKIQIQGIILIDFATFVFAVITLLIVRIPRPEPTAEGEAGRGSFWRELVYGWRYLTARSGLMGLLVLFALFNFQLGLVMALFTPMVLTFTQTDVLGTMYSISVSGMLVGGVLMMVWGGPKRRIYGVLGAMLLAGLALAFVGLRPSIVPVTVAGFSFFCCFPVITASSDALWQSKVAPDVQGRVFATRSAIATSTMVPAYLLAGPLADGVFEPWLAVGGPLSNSVGRILGVGPGRGIGLMFILASSFSVLAVIVAFLYPRIRLVEDELPDVLLDGSVAVSEGLGSDQALSDGIGGEAIAG